MKYKLWVSYYKTLCSVFVFVLHYAQWLNYHKKSYMRHLFLAGSI